MGKHEKKPVKNWHTLSDASRRNRRRRSRRWKVLETRHKWRQNREGEREREEARTSPKAG